MSVVSENVSGVHEGPGVSDEHASGDERCYKGVLADDVVLGPGMVAVVKVRVKGVKKSRHVCVNEGSEKLKSFVYEFGK